MRPSKPSSNPFVRVNPWSWGSSKSARQGEATRTNELVIPLEGPFGPVCPLTVTHHGHGAVRVVQLAGEADLNTRDMVHAALSEALSMGRGMVVVDVSGLRFCDSEFVASVVAANCDGRLVLTGHRGTVGRVFNILDPGHSVARQRDADRPPARAPRPGFPVSTSLAPAAELAC